MSFAEELKMKSQKIIEEMALDLSVRVQPILDGYAEKGYREACMSLDNIDGASTFTNAEFINIVSELLDGVKVEVVEKSVSALFPSLKKQYLQFSW